MKSHKYWSIGALVSMIGTCYTGYKDMKSAHKYFAFSSLICMAMAIYSGHKMISGKSRKRKKLQLKNLQNNKRNREYSIIYKPDGKGDSIRLFQIYSSVSGKDGLYRLFADCGTTISQNNIPDAGALLFLPVKTCPAHPQFKHNFHICHFSVSAEAAIKHIIIFGSKIWGKIFYQCHCPVDHIAKSID